METKTCNRCHTELPIPKFARNGYYPSGSIRYRAACKLCRKNQVKRVDPRPGFRQCTTCLLWEDLSLFSIHTKRTDGSILYRGDCRKCSTTRSAKWAAKNPEASRRIKKKWAKNNPENKYRRRLSEKDAYVEYVDLFTLIEQQDGQCHYCLQDLELFGEGKDYNQRAPHLEHMNPLSKGGTHSYANCVVACASCNLSKGAKELKEWLELLHFRTLDQAARVGRKEGNKC